MNVLGLCMALTALNQVFRQLFRICSVHHLQKSSRRSGWIYIQNEPNMATISDCSCRLCCVVSVQHVRFWNVLKQTRVVSAACGASLGTDPQGDVCDLTLAEAHAVGQLMTTFQLNPAPASYPSVAFWAKGPTQKFLLWPLHEMVDEHYNVYWDINNE